MHGHAADRALRNVTAKLAGQSSGRAVRLRFIECFVGQLREDQLVVLTFQITRTLILSTMPSAPRQLDDEEFPADLTGHFWATSEYRPELDRWSFKILDYQDNILLSGLAYSQRQAAAIVNAWDQVIISSGEDEDPSMG